MNRSEPCLCGGPDCPRCYPGNVRWSPSLRRWVERHQGDPQGEELEEEYDAHEDDLSDKARDDAADRAADEWERERDRMGEGR